VQKLVLVVLGLLLALGVAGPLQAQWKVAETDNFRLHGTIEGQSLVARAALLEDFHGLMVRATGRRLPADAPPLDVFLVDRIADMAPHQQLPPDAAGYYLADAGRISAVALADPSHAARSLSAQELLLHEYAHHFMLGAGRFAYPAWYVEGFAEYFATAGFGNGKIRLGQASSARRLALGSGRWLPMEQLLARDPDVSKGPDVAMFYAQSWLLTHYLFRTPGVRNQFAAYLKAYAAGADPVQAFRTHIDPDLAGFEVKLRRYLRGRASYSSFDRSAETPAAVRLTILPDEESRFLPTLVTLEHAGPAGVSVSALGAVRQLTGADPSGPFARRTLALAELEAGNSAAAARLLDGLLAETPDDAELLRWRAQAARARRTPEGLIAARDDLARALQLAPSDWRVLHAYARLQRGPTGAMPEMALNALLRAHALAPQVSEIVLDTALALSQAGRLTEAADVLEPLAWAPHGGPAASIAQRMLARARAGDREGLLAQVTALQRQKAARIAAVQSR
jgi:thioredoxin-like negative regulator of GroEL